MKYVICLTADGQKFYFAGDSFTEEKSSAMSFYSQRMVNDKIQEARVLFSKLMNEKSISEIEVVKVTDDCFNSVIEEQKEEHIIKVDADFEVEKNEERIALDNFVDPDRAMALYLWLKSNGDDLSIEDLCECQEFEFSYDGREYMVLTDVEANEKAEQYIKDNLWCFKAEFLENFTPVSADTIKLIQEGCEDQNNDLLVLVGDEIENLVEDAILLDGRAHFMNTYDDCENEFLYDGELFYIYRIS